LRIIHGDIMPRPPFPVNMPGPLRDFYRTRDPCGRKSC
jgi:hypothetical protein